MLIRSMLLACAVAAVGCVDSSNAADDSTGTVAQNSGGGFVCANKDTIQGVGCVGSIAVLPINVDVHDVGNLDNNQLSVLSDDLNNLSILDAGILNNNTILNDVHATVLNDFLTKFSIPVSGNDVNVCTSVLGILLCKS